MNGCPQCEVEREDRAVTEPMVMMVMGRLREKNREAREGASHMNDQEIPGQMRLPFPGEQSELFQQFRTPHENALYRAAAREGFVSEVIRVTGTHESRDQVDGHPV